MKTRCLFPLLAMLASAQGQPASTEGFDYPFGPPNGTPRCPGTAQSSGCWQDVQGFGVNNHLGEDWNFGFGSDDLGKPIFAAADGQVVYAQDVGGDGSWRGVIIILHTTTTGFNVPGGSTVRQVKSLYAHLDAAKINDWVAVGYQVVRGQQIGVIGSTPVGSTGPHLHLEIRTDTSTGVGPGYSSNANGWTEPTSFIEANRPAANSTSLVAQVYRAVQVSWPSRDDKQYRLLQSRDLITWEPLSDMFWGTGGPVISSQRTEDERNTFFRVEELPLDTSRRFSGIPEVVLDAASAQLSGSELAIDNMRVRSRETSFDDLVSATFVFDPTNQVFRLEAKSVATSVGVFHDPYFAKDVPSQIYLTTASGDTYSMGQRIPLTIAQRTDFFFDDLQVGHVVSFNLHQIAGSDVTYQWIEPLGSVAEEFICSQGGGGGVITDANPILKAGRYTLRLTPFQAGTATLGLTFLNANRQQMQTNQHGDWVSFQFQENIRDYAKFKVHLAKSQLLSLDDPSDSNIQITVLNELSEVAVQAVGLPVKYVAPTNGWYYIFVDNKRGWGGSYSSAISITQAPAGAGASGIKSPQRHSRGGISAVKPLNPW